MYKFFEKAFGDTKSKTFFMVNDVLAFFTVLSTVSIVLETVPSLSPYKTIFNVIEWMSVAVFLSEYIGRSMVTKPWHRYNYSFFGIVDLLAILPTLLGAGNWTFLKTARILRIIRLLRLLRLAKIARHRGAHADESLGVFALNVLIYVTMLCISLLIFGTALYIVEPVSGAFVSIPSGMWWSFKVFMGSIPVDAPLTALGAMLYVFVRFVGLLLFGVLISVTGNILREILFTRPSSK